MWPPRLDPFVNTDACPLQELTISLILSLFFISVSNCQSYGLAISFDGNPLIEEAVQDMLPDQRTLVHTL